MRIEPGDAARVTAAVKAAERETDGEVMVIVAPRSDAYHDVALHWAAIAMFLIVALVAAFPARVIGAADRLAGDWEHGLSTGALLTLLLVAQAVMFLIVRLVLAAIPLRLALTPRATKGRRVRRRAIEHFRAGIEARTATRTGALLYLSLAERRAEIVVDGAILARVPAERWGDTMATLVRAMREGRPGDGIVAAVGAIGAIMAEHFPYSGGDPNELPDGLVLL